MMEHRPVILFDGICNLCNSAVNFVIRHDRRGRIKFAALQSEQGQKLLKHYPFAPKDLSSFVLIENGQLYTRSGAALKVCKYLRGLWPLLYGFIIVPPFIRDAAYNFVAKNRYKWFGEKDQCMIPTPELKQRFL